MQELTWVGQLVPTEMDSETLEWVEEPTTSKETEGMSTEALSLNEEGPTDDDWSMGEMRPGLAATIEEVTYQLQLFLNTGSVTDVFPALWDKYFCEMNMCLPLTLVWSYLTGMRDHYSSKWLEHQAGRYGLPKLVSKFTPEDRLRAVQLTLLDTQIGRDVFCHLFSREHYFRMNCRPQCAVEGDAMNSNNFVFEEAWERVFETPLTTEFYRELTRQPEQAMVA